MVYFRKGAWVHKLFSFLFLQCDEVITPKTAVHSYKSFAGMKVKDIIKALLKILQRSGFDDHLCFFDVVLIL